MCVFSRLDPPKEDKTQELTQDQARVFGLFPFWFPEGIPRRLRFVFFWVLEAFEDPRMAPPPVAHNSLALLQRRLFDALDAADPKAAPQLTSLRGSQWRCQKRGPAPGNRKREGVDSWGCAWKMRWREVAFWDKTSTVFLVEASKSCSCACRNRQMERRIGVPRHFPEKLVTSGFAPFPFLEPRKVGIVSMKTTSKLINV